MQFPSDLQPEYRMSLAFRTYTRPDPFTGDIKLEKPATFDFGGVMPLGLDNQPVGGQAIGGCDLPIPANLVNSQSLKWEQDSNLFAAAAIDMLNNGPNAKNGVAMGIGGSQGIGNFINSLIGGRSVGPMGAVGAAVGSGGAGIAHHLLQNSGLALNPVLTQLFSHPEFKRHEFLWKFSPDTPEESSNLKSIIDTITYNSLPGTQSGGLFFTYPSIVLVKIITGGTEPYKFKPCVIENITVNHAASGVPSWFVGTSAPTDIEVKISLLEIILNTRGNSFNSGDSPIDFSVTQGNFLNQALSKLQTFKGK